ncbi:hypothetical protein [Streptomyces nanshensis]|nr:hypothetical protein [Streptomyces nanshensis]
MGLPLKAAEIATDPALNEPLGKAIREGATPGYPGSAPIGQGD